MSYKTKFKTGDTFNKLILIEPIKRNNQGQMVWSCRCDCGNLCEGIPSKLKIGHKKSCGCWERVFHPKLGKDHYSWTGYGEFVGSLISKIKANARIRNIKYDITIEYLWNLFLKQDRKCAISGIELILAKNSKELKIKGLETVSLDRIDNKKGYIEGNVQWVHKKINMMKQEYDEQYFITICKQIYEKSIRG